MKNLLYLLVIFLTSCDIISMLEFNGKENIQYLVDNDSISISGNVLSRPSIFIKSHGDFVFNIDSMIIKIDGKDVSRQDILFYYNNKLLGDTITRIEVHDNSYLGFVIGNLYYFKYFKGRTVLFPSGFIEHKGKSILNDSIVITKKK